MGRGEVAIGLVGFAWGGIAALGSHDGGGRRRFPSRRGGQIGARLLGFFRRRWVRVPSRDPIRFLRFDGCQVQSPIDVPDGILGQLGNRVQHAVRAFTPKDQKAVKAAAQTFRANPEVNVEQVILELGVGEGLVSFLDEKGTPAMVERALICPPRSQIGPITQEQRQQIMRDSLVAGVYEKVVDRESAYELLKDRAAKAGAAGGSQPVSSQQPAPKATKRICSLG